MKLIKILNSQALQIKDFFSKISDEYGLNNLIIAKKSIEEKAEFRLHLSDFHKIQLYKTVSVICFVMLVYFLIFFPHWYLLALSSGIIGVSVFLLALHPYVKSMAIKDGIFLTYTLLIPICIFIMFGENGLIENYMLGFLIMAPYVMPFFSGYRIIILTILMAYFYNYGLTEITPLFEVNERLMRTFNLIIFSVLVIRSIDVFVGTNLKTFSNLVKTNEALRKRNNDFKELAIASHHDLFEPVRTIYTLSHMVKEQMKEGKQIEPENVNYLIKASEKLTRIVEGFRQLEFIQAPPVIKRINLVSFRKKNEESLNNVEITSCTISDTFEVYTDENLLLQLLNHFLSIVKNEVEESIQISISEDQANNTLCFSSGKVKITPFEAEKYNSPHSNLTPNALHLYFGYKIAEILDIKINVKSENNRTNIYLTFPKSAPTLDKVEQNFRITSS